MLSKLDPNAKKTGPAALVSRWNARHPILALVTVSLLAVLINCHPIIFCGRSYVSPITSLTVYSWPPLFPGLKPGPDRSNHGSDTSAMMIYGVPAGFLESRSLCQHGELPLWNRYSHAGSTFIGQGITMLGDPLQLIIVLGHGSALAWDLKFVTAKFLFCLGFGMLTWRQLGSQPLALIQAALAAYCGAFYFFYCHPVFFAFAYSPWILLCALNLLDPQGRQPFRWGLAWLLVNFAGFNSGHLEVAVVLIGGLNLVALLVALLSCRRIGEAGAVAGRLAAVTLVFFGLTAPVWMSFMAALDGAYTIHANIHVVQLPLANLAGAFEDLLYLLTTPSDEYPALAPGASLLVLTGCVLSVTRWRQMRAEAFFWVNSGAIILWGGGIFGLVPESVLATIPMLNRDGHTHTDFSYLLVFHLTLQCAYGWWALAREPERKQMSRDVLVMLLVLAALLAGYDYGIPHRPIPWGYLACAAAGAMGARTLFATLRRQGKSISALGWTAILLVGFVPQFRFGLYCSGNKDLLMIPGPRLALDTPCPAIEKIKQDSAGPFRVTGLEYNLFGDYAMVHGLEDIHSCEPVTSGDYLDLFLHSPGFKFYHQWIIDVTNTVTAQPLLNLLNVKYLLGRPDAEVPGGNYRLTERSDFGVIENREVWPRAFFTDKIFTAADVGEFIGLLTNNASSPFAALTPGEMAKAPGLRPWTAGQPSVMLAATNYQLRVNSTAFDLHVPAAGLVCLTEAQARDFTATANGVVKPVLTVNRAFKGIYLNQPGDYHVQFVFRPHDWRLACLLFWLAAGTVVLLTVIHFGRARFQRHHEISAGSN